MARFAVAGQRQREGVSAVAGQSEDSDESDYYSERPKRLPIFDRIEKCGPRHAIGNLSSQKGGIDNEIQRVVDPFGIVTALTPFGSPRPQG